MPKKEALPLVFPKLCHTMNPSGRPPLAARRSTQLQHVLHAIGAQPASDSPAESAGSSASSGEHSQYPKLLQTRPALPADASPDEKPEALESTQQSARQIQQLADRLARLESELEQREANWQNRIDAWQRTRAASEAALEHRWQQLHQQAAQVRVQQQHVMQLQHDIVRSYEAVKRSVETLVDRPADAAWPQADQDSLHHELSQRFDYIARRWEHLHGLLKQQTTQLQAAQQSDDRVRWAG